MKITINIKNRSIVAVVALLVLLVGGSYAANRLTTTSPRSTDAIAAENNQMNVNSDDQTLRLTAADDEDDTTATTQDNQTEQGTASPAAAQASPNNYGTDLDPEHLFGEPDQYQRQAFSAVTRQAMPMNPEQIVNLKKMLQETKRAASIPVSAPPKPTVSTQVVNLAPGAMPPVIRLQQGFVTSVVFVDSTGADWPIDSYDVGNAKAFNIQVAAGSNAMMIQAINMYTYGNLAVKLKGMSTPVMLTLVPGKKIVDYRVDLRVQGAGPNATTTADGSVPSAVDSTLLGVLDGIPPQGAQTLQIGDAGSQAWLMGNEMYVRTRLTVLSPSWKSVVTSPDGMKAYEMSKSPMLLVSRYGKPVQMQIEGL